MPDYAAWYLDRLRRQQGVGANGAIPFWQAVGVDEIPSEYRESFFAELGCPVPDDEPTLDALVIESLHEKLSALADRAGISSGNEAEQRRRVSRLIESLYVRRPVGELKTVLGSWLADNARPIELLVESASCPSYYSPPPNLLAEEKPTLWDVLLPDVVEHRRAADAIALLATHRLADSSATAGEAITTLFRLGDRFTHADSLVANLRGVLVQRRAHRALRCWLDCETDRVAVDAWLQLLDARQEPRWVAESVGGMELAATLDATLACYAGKGSVTFNDDLPPLHRHRAVIDISRLMRRIVSEYSTLAQIARVSTRVDRRQAAANSMRAFEEDLVRSANSLWSYASILKRDWLSDIYAKICIATFLPALEAIVIAEDTACASDRLTVVAAALKLHQIENGEYPESLDALAPEPLDAVPTDPFTNAPLMYERRGDGFLLYSLGPNGEDDGGSDRHGEIADGEYLPIDWFDEREKPNGPDDVVVRFPIPVLELPERGPGD